jgi:hopanoid biosynthesis associated protein HpnK
MLKQLIVNADDLGLTVGVNDGIFDAHAQGILTSASLFASAPGTDDAVWRARRTPTLGVGVHLTLVDGTPTLPARRVPTLVAGDGRFRHSWRPFIVACLQRRVSLVEVERELTAQIDRLRAAGLRLTHLDAHKHVHAYPPLFAIVARLAARYGIPSIRVPYERPILRRLVVGPPTTPARVQAWLNAAMRPWAHHDYRLASDHGLRTPRFVGRVDTGVLSRDTVASLLRQLAPGVNELMVHPGYVDEALRAMPTRLVDSRAEELALLCSLETRALVAGERIQLVRHDLAPSVRRSLRHVS